MWTTRDCRKRAWGPAGDNAAKRLCLGEACARRCPRLVPTQSPVDHTASHRPHRGLRTPAAQRQQVFTISGRRRGLPPMTAQPKIDGGDPQRVNSIHPVRRFAPTVQFDLEQPSSLRRIRCPGCAGMTVQFRRNRHRILLARCACGRPAPRGDWGGGVPPSGRGAERPSHGSWLWRLLCSGVAARSAPPTCCLLLGPCPDELLYLH